jgi:solute carrier family 50 protein (sugar transporter)
MNFFLEADQKDTFQIIAGWIGNALALFFFLSPAVVMLKLIKGEIEHKMIPYILLIANIMNCLLWFIYGMNLEDYQIYGCNGLGGVINVIYLTIFWYFFVEKKFIYYVMYVVGSYLLLFGIWAFFTFNKTDNEIVGIVAMVFNIIMYAAPGQKLVKNCFT